MKLVWTKSNLPLSVVIRWLSKEPVSHFAIVFDDHVGGLAFHSNLAGTNLKYYPTFKKHAEVVLVMDLPLPVLAEEAIYLSALGQFDDHKYDLKAFSYFLLRGIQFRLFGTPMPKKNDWDDSNSFLCTGLAKSLDCEGSPEWLRQAVRSLPDLEMITPFALYEHLQSAYANQLIITE